MKFTSAIVALSAALTYADDLPSGAHDDRPQQARPNVCDDKCDVAFMKWYEQYKDQTDGVQLAREKTCKNDYTCSTTCGYTAVGCANPPGWQPTSSSEGGSTSTTSCSEEIVGTSTVTFTSTIPRPKLTLGASKPGVFAEVPASEVAKLEADVTTTHDHAAIASEAEAMSSTLVAVSSSAVAAVDSVASSAAAVISSVSASTAAAASGTVPPWLVPVVTAVASELSANSANGVDLSVVPMTTILTSSITVIESAVESTTTTTSYNTVPIASPKSTNTKLVPLHTVSLDASGSSWWSSFIANTANRTLSPSTLPAPPLTSTEAAGVVGSGDETTVTTHVHPTSTSTSKFTQFASTSTTTEESPSQTAGAAMMDGPALALVGGLAFAMML